MLILPGNGALTSGPQSSYGVPWSSGVRLWLRGVSCSERSEGLVKSVLVGLLASGVEMLSGASRGDEGVGAVGDAGSDHGT